MVHISKYQLFCLMVLFEIGSSILFVLGADAKQDAWIADLVAMIFGLVLMWVFTQLHKYYPDNNLPEILIKILGKVFGIPLALLYSLFFLYGSIRNFRDFGELLISSFLVRTPLLAILTVFMLIAVYYSFLGFEVIGRSSEILLPVILFFIIIVSLGIWISNRVHLSMLTPILSNGFVPILKAAYPKMVNFPFGEAAVFMMYFSHLDTKQDARKISFLSLSTAGLIICLTDIISISVLGVNLASNTTIPFYEVIKAINIANIITNLDSIGIILMFIGGFYKMVIFFYGGIQAFSTVFKIKDYRWIIIPSGIFVLWISIIFEPNYSYHIWLGIEVSLRYIYNVFQLVIPSLLLLIYWVKTARLKICKKSI